MKRILFLILLVIISFSSVDAQKPLNKFWEQTLDAWDSGNFISALEDFKKILNSPNGDEYLKEIALLTGELYKTIEISEDGRSLRFSPSGRFLIYETEENGKTFTHIFDTENKLLKHNNNRTWYIFSSFLTCNILIKLEYTSFKSVRYLFKPAAK